MLNPTGGHINPLGLARGMAMAAERRGIPWLRLNQYSLVQLGHGRFQKRIQATITSETRHTAVEIASDKEDTRNLLEGLGLPVPRQRLVYSADAAAEAGARFAAVGARGHVATVLRVAGVLDLLQPASAR